MSAPLTIERLDARYVRAPGGPGREALDRLLGRVLDDALEPALGDVGCAPGEEVCVRRVDVAVRLGVGVGSDAALARAWADAIADGIGAQVRARGEDVVRFGSKRHALLDMALCVAAGDRRREWAWRAVGLWAREERGDGASAVVDALLADEAAVVPILGALARAGLLGRLARRLDGDAWPWLGAAALCGAGASPAVARRAVVAAALPAAAPERRSTVVDPPEGTRVRRCVDRSDVARALRAAGLSGPAVAALAVAELDPPLVAGLAERIVAALGVAAAPRRAAPPGLAADGRETRARPPAVATKGPDEPACRPTPPANDAKDSARLPAPGADNPEVSGQAPPPDDPERSTRTPASPPDDSKGSTRPPAPPPDDPKGSTRPPAPPPDTTKGSTRPPAPAGDIPEASVRPPAPPPDDATGSTRPPAPGADGVEHRPPRPGEAHSGLLPGGLAAPARRDPSAQCVRDAKAEGAATLATRDDLATCEDIATLPTAGAGSPPAPESGPGGRPPRDDAPEDADGEAFVQPPADDEPPVPARPSGETAFGGLVFALNAVVALGLADRLTAELPDVELRAALHALALRLAPVEPEDPAALAFAGLTPAQRAPAALHADPGAAQAIAVAAANVRDWLADRMDLDRATFELEPLMRRRAEIVADPGWIEVHLDPTEIDPRARRSGLDIDLGHLPFLGCVVRIVYG